MGGVPVLLALAVVGVDYGYQPDGDGKIDYIVQVSPEHWDQAREAGEITSVIDPAVRGRVNRIIIRIGDGELPRDAGAPPPDESPATVSNAHALSPMPPPSGPVDEIRIAMADNDLVPTPALSANEPHGTRVMRPGPQDEPEEGGGFRYPNERAGNDADNSSREGEQPSPESDFAADRSANANRSGENANHQPTRGSDDPLGRLSGGAGAGNDPQNGSSSRPSGGSEPWVQQPSTDPRPATQPPNTQRPSDQPSSTQRPSAVAERDDSNWSENPSTRRGSSTPYPQNDANPSMDSPPATTNNNPRPATPSRGFGAQPMSPVPNRNNDYAQPNRGSADTPASLQDNRLAGYDRYGRPVNAAGELLPSEVDRQSPAEPPPGRGYNAPVYPERYSDRYAMAGPSTEHDRRQADAARRASEPVDVPQYGRDREPRTASTQEPASPSDTQSASRKAEQEIAAELAAARAALQANDDAAKSQSVVSQPVFNFLLLVSLVANAYLILQMSRLLQRYRTMVANMRSASTPTG